MGQAKSRLKAVIRETGDDIKAAQALLIEQAKERNKVSAMPDPMNALSELQKAVTNHSVQLHPCGVHTDLSVIIDTPAGIQRITYVKQVNGKVQAIANFAKAESVNDVPCFNVGYAVIDSMRGQGLATDILRKGIDELCHGLKRNGVTKLCIEAIVSASNMPSNKIATKVLSNNPIHCTDAYSGQTAMQYLKIIDL